MATLFCILIMILIPSDKGRSICLSYDRVVDRDAAIVMTAFYGDIPSIAGYVMPVASIFNRAYSDNIVKKRFNLRTLYTDRVEQILSVLASILIGLVIFLTIYGIIKRHNDFLIRNIIKKRDIEKSLSESEMRGFMKLMNLRHSAFVDRYYKCANCSNESDMLLCALYLEGLDDNMVCALLSIDRPTLDNRKAFIYSYLNKLDGDESLSFEMKLRKLDN